MPATLMMLLPPHLTIPGVAACVSCVGACSISCAFSPDKSVNGYRQSGIDGVKWENIPNVAKERMADELPHQYADWFGMGGSPDIDTGICWERLSMMPGSTASYDMLIPTRLATRIEWFWRAAA